MPQRKFQTRTEHSIVHHMLMNMVLQRLKKVAQLSQRDHAAVWHSYGQKWKTGAGRQYFMYITALQIHLQPL